MKVKADIDSTVTGYYSGFKNNVMIQTAELNKVILCTILLLVFIAAKPQTAELPDISADRPGMATTPDILQPKKVQIETGFSYERTKIENSFQKTTHYNSTLLRYGINQNSEIRIQTDFEKLKTDSLNFKGFNPVVIGTKLLISEEKGIIPKTAFLFNLTLPFLGEKKFRPQNATPSLYFLMTNNISKYINICYNIGLEYDGESTVPKEFAAVCMGYNLTDNLSLFLENYDWFSKASKPETFIDFGFAYLSGKNVQIDLSGNIDPQDFENYFMINFGISWRLTR